MKHIIYKIIGMLMLGIFSCIATKINAQSRVIPDGEIIYLFFNKNGENISLRDYKIVKGSIKDPTSYDKAEYGFIKYLIESENSDEIYKSVLKDPLIERIEYIDDNGNWTSDQISREMGELVIRLPFKGIMNNGKVIFEKVSSNSSSNARATQTNEIQLPKFR